MAQLSSEQALVDGYERGLRVQAEQQLLRHSLQRLMVGDEEQIEDDSEDDSEDDDEE